MFQVTFQNLLPSDTLLARAEKGHAELKALGDPRLLDGCLAITVHFREGRAHRTATYRIVFELVNGERSLVTVITEAHSPEAALDSGLAVAKGFLRPARLAEPKARELPEDPARILACA